MVICTGGGETMVRARGEMKSVRWLFICLSQRRQGITRDSTCAHLRCRALLTHPFLP
jgi:hypothetical protein